MASIRIDFEKVMGPIRPMHAVGQPPYATALRSLDLSPMAFLRDAHIPYSRLHDVGGAFGGNRFVDIPNIFRDFDADENDPASYDFAFTDILIKGLLEYGVAPMFRLGVTIENQAAIRAYRIYPPKDYGKWARICEHIVRHYNEGWADGFHMGIEYWEIWNEPENGHTPETNQMWLGTPEDYFRLYDVAAKHLKACFGDAIKIGGYAATNGFGIFYHPKECGFSFPARPIDPADEKYQRYRYRLEFLHGFLAYVKAHGSPIDFFSWHSYGSVEETLALDDYFYRTLAEYGFADIEIHLNEWNNAFGAEKHGTQEAAAAAGAMMLAMHGANADILCYYDAKLQASVYGGFFKPLSRIPTPTYHAFRAFGELYALGNEVAVLCDTEGLYALAAKDEAGKNGAVMLVNYTGRDLEVQTNAEGFTLSLLNADSPLLPTDLDATAFSLQKDEIALLEGAL